MRRSEVWLFGGLTAVLLAYFLVWLPGPSVGLRFMGVELGEWIKFLGVGSSRTLFYVPPITLGLMLALLTLTWENGRWQTWMMRLLAVSVSLLIFPSLEIVIQEPPDQWLLRILLIGLVGVVALLSSLRLFTWPRGVLWGSLIVLGVLGTVLPTWIYFEVRPLVINALQQPIGIGGGVWLNGVGHLICVGVGVYHLFIKKTRRAIS